ncbi:unnamed protein product [Wuchereria bancrofti]|uniref:Uncharacterized protein n=1 Tax=Wuchereria bancrofti TaxID=6293 RepID=A0A3P7FPK5_WUCBA|nr:unnamed protein product [Wuchereria bancrofti]
MIIVKKYCRTMQFFYRKIEIENDFASIYEVLRNFRIVRPTNSSLPANRKFFDVEQDNYIDHSYQTVMNSNNSRTVPVQLIRKTSVDDFNERMIGMLDQVEKRVEQLRESAGQLEQERESLINMLGNVNLDSELLRLGQGKQNYYFHIENNKNISSKFLFFF